MKKLIPFIALFIFMSSCWAPRCPMETCKVQHEHKHNDFVSGVFNPRKSIVPKRIHFLWEKDKGENNPNTDLQTSGGRKKIKGKKKFPWERW